MSKRSRSKPLSEIAARTRTIMPDRALEAARVAIRAMGVNPDRAASAVRESDATFARKVLAGVLYRSSRVSLQRAATILRIGKATAQARISAFERMPERDEVLNRVASALARMPV